jgi:uncharacterized membrane protein YobD (UPF0266 family)
MALKARARASKSDDSEKTANSPTNGKGSSTVDNDDDKKTQLVLTSAPPSWHSVAILSLMAVFFIRTLPTWSQIDEIAVTETFTRRIFPELISLRTLATIRTVQAVIIWVVSLHAVFISDGFVFSTSYVPHSKLKMVNHRLTGIRTMFPFTSVSWNLLGAAFTLSAYIAWSAIATDMKERGDDSLLLSLPQLSPSWNTVVLRTAILVWEVAAPNTLLVAAVVRYVIWPGVLRGDGDTSNLRNFRNMLMHNGNVLLALIETALTGGLPVRWSEVSLAPILGCMYVLFSWYMIDKWDTIDKWNTKENGPQFIYFFFDTTLGAATSYALVALLAVLLIFYTLFVSVEHILAFMDGGWPFHVAFVVAVSSAVMRSRDY